MPTPPTAAPRTRPTRSPTSAGPAGSQRYSWTPAIPGATHELPGERVDAGGEQRLLRDLRDTSTDRAPVRAAWRVCGLAFRGVGATDIDGDGQQDTRSSMVDGAGCTLAGRVTRAFDGVAVPATTARRPDGCSTWCVAPELKRSLP